MASMNYPEAVLCVSTKWDETTQQMIGNFCQTIPKQTPDEPSKVYCTVLDVELSKEQTEDAARHGVTLIPPTRPKWSDAAEDPPAISWLFSHVNYYPNLQTLEHITHVVALSAKTKTAASAIHDNLFPQAKFDPVNSKPAALFLGNSWNKDELGLTGFHRTLIKDFCKRKTEVGEDVKAYSTVLDVKISDEQKTDAESCGVTLIEAQRMEGIEPKYDPPRPDWLLLYKSYYPNLGEIENVHYVIGYAPKTGIAAAYIREKLFPGAKLVLINHACPESNCLQVEEYRPHEFEKKMLQMARKADLLFSIGPKIYEYFLTAYKGHICCDGKELSEIPHEEILPLPISCSLGKEPGEGEIRQHQILTCGQMDTKEAIDRCNIMAASIGNAANQWRVTHTTPPKWKIQGVSKQAGEIEVKFLIGKMKCPHVQPILHPGHSAKDLLTSLQQSHLCLPSSCYTDYSFYGMEAMVSGLPTAVDESSHLGCFINKYLKEHAVNCVLPAQARKKDLSAAIFKYLNNTAVAFKHAKGLATDLFNSEDMAKRYAIFTTILSTTVKQQTHGDEVGRDMTDTLPIQIELDARDGHHQHLRETEEGVKALLAKGSKEPEQEMVNKLKIKLTHRVEEVVADEDRREEVMKICKKILEDVEPKLLTVESLGILLRFLTLYNLYKLKQTCRSGSLARAFEPLLITDEMREIAAEAGIKLQLKATYDPEKFEEVEVFFINRDGGGIQPVEFYDNIIEEENDENLTFDRHDTVVTEDGKLQLKSNVTETGQIDSHQKDQGKGKDPSKLLLLELDGEREIKSSTETNVCSLFKVAKCIRWTGRQFDVLQAVMTMTDRVQHILSYRQEILALLGVTRYLLAESGGLTFLELEEQLIQHGEPTQPIRAVYETLSLQARSLLPHKPRKKKLTDSEIRYLELAQSKVHSLQSQLDKAFTEKKLLETQLAEALQEKLQQERRCQEYRQRCHSAEKVVSTRLSDMHKFKDRVEKLQIKLKEKDKLITELMTRLSQLSDAQSDIELQKKIAMSLQLGGNVSTEMKEMEMIDTTVDNVHAKTEMMQTEKEKPQKLEMTVKKGNEMETATSIHQREKTARDGSEIEITTPRKRQKTGKDRSEIDSATPTLPDSREGCQMETITVSTAQEHHKGKSRSDGSMVTPGSAAAQGQTKFCAAHGEVLPIGSVSSEMPGGMLIPGSEEHQRVADSEDSEEMTGSVHSEMIPGSEEEQRVADSEDHEEMTGSVSSEMSGDMVIPGSEEEQNLSDSDDSGEMKSSSESSEETSDSTTIAGSSSVSENWSKKILSGNESKMPGKRFYNARGMTFHNNKLLVCDTGNHIVRILNQDYTCQQVLGCFSGQFANPFSPRSIAVSQDNLYFILDDINVQVVVCDQNNKVVKLINLPKDSHPTYIALVKEFVIVTEGSRNRIFKYSQDGQYIAEIGGKSHGPQFRHLSSVVVNSKDVIMVSDCNNDCIKCFDLELNSLFQYGQTGDGNGQMLRVHGIATDGNDNVYVCDWYNDRIVKWSSDGKWICNLFQRERIYPEYIAVTTAGDVISVVESNSGTIVIFSR